MTMWRDQGVARGSGDPPHCTTRDFDQPPPGVSPAVSLAATKIEHYVAYLPALDGAWRVGRVVVEEIAEHWDRYRDVTPGKQSN